MGHILWVEPVFKEMLWGKDKLKTVFGYDIPSDSTGECWAISAHQNGDCIISEGEFKGMTLSKLYQSHRDLFGNTDSDKFPLLVKLIDANDNLSVQIHPDDTYASKHENSLGKTECWYVIDAEKDAEIIVGHNAKSKEELINSFKNNEIDKYLKRVKVKPGDFFYIPAGTIHAICKGVLIYELQQASDITYRIYDYNRVNSNGEKRELHIDKACDVISEDNEEITDIKPVINIENGKCIELINSKFFTLKKYEIDGLNTIINDKEFLLVSVIGGHGKVQDRDIKLGDHFIVCNDVKDFIVDGKMTLMIGSL